MNHTRSVRDPAATRRALIEAAFLEFYRHGYQGGSLQRVTGATGSTKGALFHHFSGKQQLGYAVVDELIAPLLRQRWLEPVLDAADPIIAIQHAFRAFVREDIASGHWAFGCPLNNLAQEMSPLDEGFRQRIDALYAAWRGGFAEALGRGIERGSVRADVIPEDVAALLVALQMGIWGTGKYSQDETLMTRAAEAACAYLDSLRAR